MEGNAIIEKILPGRSACDKTLYLLYNYKDLKNGKNINEESREVIKIIDKAISYIEDDKYIDIIKMIIKGKTVEEIAETITLERNAVYKQRRRLIKRLAVLIYGDKAL